MSTLPDPEGRKLLRIEVRNSQTPIEKKPEWIRTTAKAGENYQDMRSLSHAKGLHTVCAEAGCPNIYECWQDREATFLLGGALCTRRCDFCDIATGRPTEYDKDEPRRIAESVRDLDLRYVTITGVTRDDLPDGAAWLYAETCRLIHELNPGTGVELLVDACGQLAGQARTCLRQARTDIEDETLSRGQLALNDLGVRGRGRQLIHARSSVIRPRQQRLNVGRTPAQDILDGCASRMNLREALRIRVQAGQVDRDVVCQCIQFECLTARPPGELCHGLVEARGVIQLSVGTARGLDRPRKVAAIIALQEALCDAHERAQILDVGQA